MAVKNYIKHLVRYILHGIPMKNVYVQAACLSQNELLKGRTALITGGTSGIGKEMAKAFINAGATVVITGRNTEKVCSVCKQIDEDVSRKGCIFGIEMDNTQVSNMPEKFQEILNLIKDRRLDILINNAGIGGGEIKNCTEEQYDAIFDTNLKGTFFLSKIAANYFIENNITGNILNIGSSSSLRPAASAYTMTKWGILGLTRGLAKLLAPHDITVNGLAPGPTATPMTMPNGINKEFSFPNPLGRYATVGEIASMAVILVSDICRSVIGDMVFMTGGSGVVTYDDVKYSF